MFHVTSAIQATKTLCGGFNTDACNNMPMSEIKQKDFCGMCRGRVILSSEDYPIIPGVLLGPAQEFEFHNGITVKLKPGDALEVRVSERHEMFVVRPAKRAPEWEEHMWLILGHTQVDAKEPPAHHIRYARAWALYQDEKLDDEAKLALEKEMDSAQNDFSFDEFQVFKKKLPGYMAYWENIVPNFFAEVVKKQSA